jgi:hypothetical protein
MTIVISWALSALFGIAAVQTLASPAEFRNALGVLLRVRYTRQVALGVCVLEAATSIGLVFTPTRGAGAALAIALASGFFAANVRGHLRDKHQTCNCPGGICRNKMLGMRNLMLPTGILAVAVYVLLFPGLTRDSALAGRFGLLTACLAILLGSAVPPIRAMLRLRAANRA